MKIAISSTGTHLDDPIDPRFGRCPYFIIIDPATLAFEAIENPSAQLSGGAGIHSAQHIADKGANVVLTGNCGPNALKTLHVAKVKVVKGVSGSVREAVAAFTSGSLSASASEDNPICSVGNRGAGRRRMAGGRG